MHRAWSASWLTQTSARRAGSAASQSSRMPSTAAAVAGSSEAVGSSSRSTAGSNCKAQDQPDQLRLAAGEVAAVLGEERAVAPQPRRRSSTRPASNARPPWAASANGRRRLSSTFPSSSAGQLVEVDDLLAISGHGITPHGAAVPADRPFIERVEQREGPQQHRLPRTEGPRTPRRSPGRTARLMSRISQTPNFLSRSRCPRRPRWPGSWGLTSLVS